MGKYDYLNDTNIEKSEKVIIVINEYLNDPTRSLEELTSYLNEEGYRVSSSTIQRYIKDNVKELFGEDAYKKICYLLEQNKIRGNLRGGENSYKNNTATRNINGKFTGSKIDKDNSRVEKNEEDIKLIAITYLNNSGVSVNELVNILKEEGYNFSKDYVYNCLKSSKVSQLLGNYEEYQVNTLLDQNNRFKKNK